LSRPYLRMIASVLPAAAAFVLADAAILPPHQNETAFETSARVEKLLTRGEQHWREQRYDLAAQDFAEAHRLHPDGPSGERAGVMASRALLELGRPDDARPLLEAVASADTGGYWWGHALLHLARITPAGDDRRFLPSQDWTDVAAQAATARQHLERAIAHFRTGAAADSAWRDALVDADAEFLARLRSIPELDRALEEMLGDAIEAEQQAELWMAYARGLRFVQTKAFLREKELMEQGERLERIRHALEQVIHGLESTSRTPEAYALHIAHFEDLDYLRELLERYPDSGEAARARQIWGRRLEPSVDLLTPAVATPGDTIQIRIITRNLEGADLHVVRLGVEDWLWSRLGSRRRCENPKAFLAPMREFLRRRQRLVSRSFRWSDLFQRRHMIHHLEIAGAAHGRWDTTHTLELPRGHYKLWMTGPGIEVDKKALSVGDLRLNGGASRDSIFTIVTASNYLPAEGVRVLAYSSIRAGDDNRRRRFRVELVGSGVSDANGRVNLGIPPHRSFGRFLIVAYRGEDIESTWIDAWNEARGHLLAWTDRTVYRPGDTIHLLALLLRPPAHHWTPGASESLQVTAHMPPPAGDPTATPAGWDTTLVTDRFGIGRAALVLPEDVRDGTLAITAETTVAFDPLRTQASVVRIAAFERLDFELRAEPRKREFAPGDTVEIEVRAATTHGLPLAGARLTCSVFRVEMARLSDLRAQSQRANWYRPPANRPTVVVRGPRQPFRPATLVRNLGLDGRALLRIPTQPFRDEPEAGIKPGTRREPVAKRDAQHLEGLAIDITVDDGAGRQRTTCCEVALFPERIWCFANHRREERQVQIWRLDNRNHPVPGPVHYRWIGLIPDIACDCYIEDLLASGSIRTNSEGWATLAIPSGSDSLHLALDVWAVDGVKRWTWLTYPPPQPLDQELNRHRLFQLKVDKSQYAIGDTAVIWRSQAARLRAGVLWGQGWPLTIWPPGPDSVIRLPVLATYLPQLGLELTLNDRDDRGATYSIRENIVVEPSSRFLTIKMALDRRSYGPGDTAEVHVEARDCSDKPVEAAISIAAVDETVFEFAEDKLEIERALYQLEESHNMALSAPAYTSREVAPPPPSLPRFAFQPTAFWSAEVTTDPTTGKAILRAPLPHDLARWRVTVRAVDMGGRVGQAMGAFTTDHGVQLRPRLPRFVRAGDWFGFGAHIDNRSGSSLRLRVTWSANALQPVGSTTRSMTVKPGAIAVASFTAAASEAGADSITMVVEGTIDGRPRGSVRESDLEDRIRVPLPVEARHGPALPAVEERIRMLSYSIGQLLSEVRKSLEAATARAQEPAAILALLLRHREGIRLLEGKGGPVDPPKVLEPDMHVVTALRRELASRQREVFDRHNHGMMVRHRDILNLLCDLEEARQLRWWRGETKSRQRLVRWFEGQLEDPSLAPEERVLIAVGLKRLGRDMSAHLDRLWEERQRLGPGGRALLAEATHETRPRAAHELALSAAGFARFDPDTTYAYFEPPRSDAPAVDPYSDRSWPIQPVPSAAHVLFALASVAPGERAIQPLANALALERASQGWPVDLSSSLALQALLQLARTRAGAPGLNAPLNRPELGGKELRIDRRVWVRDQGSGPSQMALGKDGAPDTLLCAVGDSLQVMLAEHSLPSLAAIVIDDPTPAGCRDLGAEFPSGVRRTVRDDRVLFSSENTRRSTPDDMQISHVLLAERQGLFHTPPARAYPARLPALEARSDPFVIRIVE